MYSTLGSKLNIANSHQNFPSQRPRRMPIGMDHRAAYTVVVWRSQPHLPAASTTTAVVQAVHRRHGATTHMLTAHVRTLLQVVANHIVLARRLAEVVRFMHGAIRSGCVEGCLSRG